MSSTVSVFHCQIGVTEQTYYRWRKQYSGMKRINRIDELLTWQCAHIE